MLLETRIPATNIKGVGEPRTCKTCMKTLIATVENFKAKKSKFTAHLYFNTECRNCENKRRLKVNTGFPSALRLTAKEADMRRLAYYRNLNREELEIAKLRESY